MMDKNINMWALTGVVLCGSYKSQLNYGVKETREIHVEITRRNM